MLDWNLRKRGIVIRKTYLPEQTYYRWRREYGGLWIEQARRLKELEKENHINGIIGQFNSWLSCRIDPRYVLELRL